MRKGFTFHQLFKRENIILIFISLFFTLISGCGSGGGGDSQETQGYTVQVGVEMDNDGGHAYAVVLNESGLPIPDAVLTINGARLVFIQEAGENALASQESSSANEEKDVDDITNSNYYYLSMPYLKGGDVLTLTAQNANGQLLHNPKSAVVPMPIQLLSPVEGQTIMAGDDVPVNWKGGDGANIFTVSYVALDQSAEFRDYLSPGGLENFTIPSQKTVAGSGIVGVAAMTGNTEVMGSFDADFRSSESYFLVTRYAGVSAVFETTKAMLKSASFIASNETCPPWNESPNREIEANTACLGQFMALGIGAIVWEARRVAEFKVCPKQNNMCNYFNANNLAYCVNYGAAFGFTRWVAGCRTCCMVSREYNWHCRLAPGATPKNPTDASCKE
jgi:hypothetical protein